MVRKRQAIRRLREGVDGEPSPDAERILVERVLADFDAGLLEVRRRLREDHARATAASLDALLAGVLRALRVRQRLAGEARSVLRLGVRAHRGEDPRRLADEAVDRVLAWKAGFLGRRDDPEYEALMRLVKENAARRLPDLGRLALVPHARDVPDLLRQAFPERLDAERIVEENLAWMAETLDRLERRPEVLRAPRGLVLKAAQTGRGVLAWQAARIRRELDEAYGPPPPGVA